MLLRRILFSRWTPLGMSLLATTVSLSWSLVIHWTPCELCWIERACMYPLVLVFLIGLYTRQERTRLLAAPFVLAGLVVSAYHYGLQLAPGHVQDVFSCSPNVPCQMAEFRYLHFITPPLLAAVGFVAVGVAVFNKSVRNDQHTHCEVGPSHV